MTYVQYEKKTKYKHTNINDQCTVKKAQCDKTQSGELRTAHLSMLMTVHNFSTHKKRNGYDNLPSYLQTTIIFIIHQSTD